MARGELLVIAILAAITLTTCQENEKPLSKCWKCSSNAKGFEFCDDPFDGDKLDESLKAIYYVDCPAPPNREIPQHNQKVVCRKLKQNENGTTVVHRSCFWQDGPEQQCVNSNLPSYITVESCELCGNGDGCNGASQFGSVAVIIAIPLIVAKMLLP